VLDQRPHPGLPVVVAAAEVAARAALPLDVADEFRIADVGGHSGRPVVESGRQPGSADDVGHQAEAGHVPGVLLAGAEPVDRVQGAQPHERAQAAAHPHRRGVRAGVAQYRL
jgi:hypothetical protein